MQFLIVAKDGTDTNALARRLQHRPAHLELAKNLKKTGNFIAGGALLNEAGDMVGSSLYMEFDNRQELDKWLEQDPYMLGGVWQDVQVHPIRLVDF